MITLQEAIEKGHTRYFKNSYWKGLYDAAPAEAKPYYDLKFSLLDGGRESHLSEEYKAKKEEAFRNMSSEGWDYIIENMQNGQGKYYLKKERERFEKKEA